MKKEIFTLQSLSFLFRWEKVRELAMKKQSELHRLIMNLQMEQITNLKEWMTNTENRISRLDPINTDTCAKTQVHTTDRFLKWKSLLS